MTYREYDVFRSSLPPTLDERLLARSIVEAGFRDWIATNFSDEGKVTEDALASFFFEVARLTGEFVDSQSETQYKDRVANWKRAGPKAGSSKLALAAYFTIHSITNGKALAERIDRAVLDGLTIEKPVNHEALGFADDASSSEDERPRKIGLRKRLSALAAPRWFIVGAGTIFLGVVSTVIAEGLFTIPDWIDPENDAAESVTESQSSADQGDEALGSDAPPPLTPGNSTPVEPPDAPPEDTSEGNSIESPGPQVHAISPPSESETGRSDGLPNSTPPNSDSSEQEQGAASETSNDDERSTEGSGPGQAGDPEAERAPSVTEDVTEDTGPEPSTTERGEHSQANEPAPRQDPQGGNARLPTVRVYASAVEGRQIERALADLGVRIVSSPRNTCLSGNTVTSIWPDQSVDFGEFKSITLTLMRSGFDFYVIYPKHNAANQVIDIGSIVRADTCTISFTHEPFSQLEIISARYFCGGYRPLVNPPPNWSPAEIRENCFYDRG